MPIQSHLATIQCPGCGKTLVAGTQQCQFCGAATGQIPLPAAPSSWDARRQGPDMARQEVAYWILAWIWVAGGVFGVLQALGMAPMLGGVFGPFASLQLVIGIGLLTQNEWVIFIAKLLTYFNVIGACLGLVFSFMAKDTLVMVLSLGYNSFMLALAIFQIYIFNYMSD